MSQATIDLARRELDVSIDTPPAAPTPGYWKSVAQRLARDPVTIAVTLVLLGIMFISLGAPLVAGADPYAGSVLARLKPIGTPGHWLGTDETGRDLWTRLCYGGRLSLLAGILPVTISLMIGGFLGILAGYAGGHRRHADHAHDGRVLRLPLDPAGDRDLRPARQRTVELDPGAVGGVHPADGAHFGNRDDAGAATGFRRGGARVGHHDAADHPPPCAGQRARARSWSTRPA